MAKRGRLKIYFGYSQGVGKTYRMLKDAHEQARRGTDIVIGYIADHSGTETMELTEGLEVLRYKIIAGSKGTDTLTEFHLEGALFRRPQAILIDEMAHTNAAGSKHEKRFQDIEELLSAGIDVYTTVNAQQIESLSKAAAETLKTPLAELIPDYVFDCAESVKLIDPEPEELIKRHREGKVFSRDQTGNIVKGAFKKNNLDKLRELSIKKTTDRINQIREWI
ncbi:MAG: hypothetical protein PHV71_03585 [Eubacteriales bacterium]|nr:hypothetical protein [Eubacteriales bacterium]MDD3199086.1 hypothetical protein [Eubacteriales bacterium]MDD4629671.1 hypothetical protein [Eubacteriales bacterium]